MAKMPRLLRREPAIDEGELELARARSLERLRQIGAPREAETPGDSAAPEAVRPPIEVVGVEDEVEAESAAEPVEGAASPAADDAQTITTVVESVDADPIADDIDAIAEPVEPLELSDDAPVVISLPSPIAVDDDEPTDNELVATELAATALTIDERDDTWLNLAESGSGSDEGEAFEAAAIEIAPWPEAREPEAALETPIEPAGPLAVDVAVDVDMPAMSDSPAAERVEPDVAAAPTRRRAKGARARAKTAPIAMAPAEADVDIGLVAPEDLAGDGWAADWGLDVLAPHDLTDAAFGRTNGAYGPPADPIEPEQLNAEPIDAEATEDGAVAADPAADATDAAPIEADDASAFEEPVAVDIEPVADVAAAPMPVMRPVAAPQSVVKAAARKRPKPSSSTFAWPAQASCPYCAQLLVPAPTTHKRCPRCRQRVVVRRVGDRVAFLTEASVAIFESERRRAAESKHWTAPRKQWVRLAEAAGAPPDRIAKLNETLASPETVFVARSIYFAAVDRAVKVARAEHDWPLAVRLRRAQAAAVSKLGGSPVPPPDDAVELHRDAAAIELRGIQELAREAELVGGPCCPACDADAGHSYRIGAELHAPRLPHADCPHGLCGCHWQLSDRDRANLERLLRRGARA